MGEFSFIVPKEAEHAGAAFYTADASVNFHFVL